MRAMIAKKAQKQRAPKLMDLPKDAATDSDAPEVD
jgi:hypothetical protein